MASEYRSQSQPKSSNSRSKINRPRYTDVVQGEVFPKKDQGIVIESQDGIQLKDYIFAIGKIAEPKNIKFASRISNNRIGMFLSSKEIAEKLTTEHKQNKYKQCLFIC